MSYIAVELPAAERLALGIDDDLVNRLRSVVATDGPDAAGPLLPQAVVDHYAIVGDRSSVADRLGELRARIGPELLVFDAGDYSIAFIDEVASLATEAGAIGGPVASDHYSFD